jgi:MYXO-CTERM domain-containing protein
MDFRAARGRAIHIHDELVYANVSAYFGMNSIWDTLSESFHFGTDGSALLTTAHDTLVLVEQSKDTVNISGMGRAIGHYARFVSRGAKRIDATSDNGLVLVSAFSEADQFVFVLVNDAAESAKVSLSIQGGALAKVVSGEQSTKDAYWKPLTTFAPTDPSNLDVTLPAESITSLVVSPSAVVIEPGGSAGTGNNAGGATGNAGAPSTGGKSGSSAGAPGTGGTDNQGAGAGTTGGKGQTSATASDSSGCGCRLASPAEPHGVWWLSGLGALAWVARRRFAARSLHPTLGKS